MKLIPKYCFLLFLMGASFLSKSQDIHFSQYSMQPLSVNVGLAGDYKGDMRFAVINRRQWGQLGVPINTYGASMEKRFRFLADFLIFGAQFIHDKADAQGLITNKAYFSTTYQLVINQSVFHFAGQLGYVNTTIDPDQTFPSQFNSSTGTFDSGLNNGETILGDGKGYLDVNVGLLWSTTWQNRIRFRTGLSLAHVNFPNEAFSATKSRIPIKVLLHHMTEFRVNGDWAVIPSGQLMYTKRAKQFIASTQLRRHLNPQVAISGGLGYRGYLVQSDALIALLGIRYENFDFGFSYDWNVSQLSEAGNPKSSLEVGVVVRTPPRKYKPVTHRKNKPCPVYVGY